MGRNRDRNWIACENLGSDHVACPLLSRKKWKSPRVQNSQAKESRPVILPWTRALLQARGVEADIVELSGSVEIAPGLGTADAISDLVSTGTTLRANHLREFEVLFESEAALYAPQNLEPGKQDLLDRLIARLEGVVSAAESKYVMLHAPRAAVTEITELLPGVEHPTVLPLEGSERVAMHAVCREELFWEHLEALKSIGASAILVLPVEKMLA